MKRWRERIRVPTGVCVLLAHRVHVRGDRAKIMAVLASAATRWILVAQPPLDLPMDCGPFFLCASAVRVHFDAGTIQRNGFDFDAIWFVVAATAQRPSEAHRASPIDSFGCRWYASYRSILAVRAICSRARSYRIALRICRLESPTLSFGNFHRLIITNRSKLVLLVSLHHQ